MSKIGITQGGISTLYSGFRAKRPGGRGYHIIIFTLSGAGEFIMEDGTKLFTKEKDMYFSHSNGQGHIHRPSIVPWEILWLRVSPRATWFDPPTEDWQISQCSEMEKIRFCLDGIIKEDVCLEFESSRVQNLMAELFFIYLQREMHLTRGPQKARHRSRFNQLWAEVSKTLAKPWSLDDLCDYMGVGRAHLIRLCAEFYQTTPAAKVRSIKMEFAQSLLQNFEYPVAEIAEHIGYDSPSTFSTAFKKYFGYPPRERKQERTKGYS